MPRRSKKVSFKKRTIKKSFRKVSSWIIGLALLPTLAASFLVTLRMFTSLGSETHSSAWLYVGGAFAYFLFERWIFKPMWLYVFAHELTHAISGILTGAKVYSFKATSNGGEVRLSKANWFVSLSPYIVPFYTMVVIGAYATVKHWWYPPYLDQMFQFVMGVSLAFHWSFTLEAVHTQQPDLRVWGLFLSGVFIFITNILILAILAISLFEGTPSFQDYFFDVAKETFLIWEKGILLAKQI